MDASRWNDAYRQDPDQPMVRDIVVAKAIEGLTPGKALDIGCGIGSHTLMLARKGWTATGVDISAEAIRLAEHLARQQGLDARFINADITTWEPDQQYDLVILTYALPGGANSHKAMHTATRALKPGGTLIAVEWDHSMAERWAMGPDDLPSPSDLAAMVPELIIESAESRSVSDLLRDDARHASVDATIAFLRARKPDDGSDDDEQV